MKVSPDVISVFPKNLQQTAKIFCWVYLFPLKMFCDNHHIKRLPFEQFRRWRLVWSGTITSNHQQCYSAWAETVSLKTFVWDGYFHRHPKILMFVNHLRLLQLIQTNKQTNIFNVHGQQIKWFINCSLCNSPVAYDKWNFHIIKQFKQENHIIGILKCLLLKRCTIAAIVLICRKGRLYA